MRWEELTGDEFPAAVEQSQGVCLVPLSVVERHGHHLPLGTDTYIAREIVRRAAAQEPVLEFPDYIFTQIPEARHHHGTISIARDLVLALLDNVCSEIARNGLHKIVLVNAHGGNTNLLRYFAERQLYEAHDYVVYIVQPISLGWGGELPAPWTAEQNGHAGAGETSMILTIRPDLVHLDRVPTDGEGRAQQRLSALQDAGVHTGIWWYADFPTHYQGDAAAAHAETGDRWLDAMSETTVRAIRAIKADTETRHLQDEFYAASRSPRRQASE